MGEQLAFLRRPNSKEEWGRGILQPERHFFCRSEP